ncbi:Glucosamine 6-phosphate N-acetyltransferase [Exophiala dermatitidis]
MALNGKETDTQAPSNGVAAGTETQPTPTVSTKIVNGITNGIAVAAATATSIPGVETLKQTVTNKQEDDDQPLFSPSLISDEVSSSLPDGYTIRPLRRSDYYGGFLDTLRVLTTVGEPTLAEFNARYDFMASRNDTYYILVICDTTGTVVGTGAVIVERKFIHNMGLVGHIEDIAVAKNQQGKKLGLRIIQALDAVAENVGCYKSILDCSEANEGFYVKCGFKRAGLEMAHYYEKKEKPQTETAKTNL